MGKFLKKFTTHTAYESYISGLTEEEVILPNVSYCVDANDVHYNPWVETRLVAKFNVTSTSSATAIMNSSATSYFTEIEIDGVVQPNVVSSYTFDTTGEHTVKYTLANSTSIGSNAFGFCSGLTSVTIPNSVTSIGDGAFNGCFALTSITIPNSVTSIGTGALQYCSSLTSITIPNSVTTIGSNAFTDCTGLISITIPDSVTTIGEQAFINCGSLINIIVDSNNSYYNSRDNCNAIIETSSNTLIKGCQNTIIPNSVTTISMSAFLGCIGLTSITIPSGVTSIGSAAFKNCTGLTSITSLATTAPTISNSTFQGVKTGGTLTVPTGSTGYDVWMGTGNYYLGKYSWTKVEQ